MNDIIRMEQRINERLGTDSPPDLDAALLPEHGRWSPMPWGVVEKHELSVLSDGPDSARGLIEALAHERQFLFPLHPLVAQQWQGRVIHDGEFTVSASYRTVYLKPDRGSRLWKWTPENTVLAIKLHLDEPLPGIAGDRRLPHQKVEKCVRLSGLLPDVIDGSRLTIVREPVGLVVGERGAIFRPMPSTGVMPLFAVYSRDADAPKDPPWIVTRLESVCGSARRAAEDFGALMAEPLVAALLEGFRAGFALEMHAQNTLVRPWLDDSRLFSEVMFRDLEGVVCFPRLFAESQAATCALNEENPEYFPEPHVPRRWFNRNLDHDIGRSLRWSLWVLERERYFSAKETRRAIRSIRGVTRSLIRRFGLQKIAWPGRWLPYSRAPYGSGLRLGHYYRSRFR